MCLWLVLCREENHGAQVALDAQVDQIPPSESSGLAGPLSNEPVRREEGLPLSFILKGFFIFIFVSKNWAEEMLP